MPRSSSPRQGDPRYWRQWTVRGANLDQIISPQQRTHYLRFSLLPHKQGGKRLCTLQGSCDHKKSKREKETSTFSSRRKEQRNVTFFSKGPSSQVRRQAGQELLPVHFTSLSEQRRGFQSRETVHHLPQARSPLYHEPKLPLDQNQKPLRGSSETSQFFTKSNLESLGIKMD